MTISTTIVKNSYNGDASTTVFNYTFKILADTDLKVIVRSSNGTETIKTLSTHYTITGANNAGGGTVVFITAPIAGETVVLLRDTDQVQSIDYISNDPFPAETHEEGLDRGIILAQELQEELNRSIKLSRTNTMTSTEFSVGAAERAGKILGFDANGELVVSQELGSYAGVWGAATTYSARDIVKDSSNNNIYLCNTGHTSSGTVPISSNADSSKWDLLVDAASATASAAAAASSATDAQIAQTASETAQVGAELAETNAETAKTAAELAETNAETAKTAAELAETNAGTSETNAASSASTASSSASTATTQAGIATTQSGIATTQAGIATTKAGEASSSAATASGHAATATTQAGIATTQASNASTSASNAATSESNAASSESNASTSATNASNAQTAAEAAQAAAEIIFDNFDDKYLGSKSSNPSLDNDGNALTDGALYFNTVDNRIKIYDLGTTTWLYIAPSSSDQSSINTVATNIADVTTVSTNLASVNSFANTYRIAASAPVTSLDVGDLYFDTTANELKVYKSSGWSAAGSTVNGTSARFTYNITGTPSSVTGVDANGSTLAYDAGFADVYVNGVRMSSSDITITSGSSVVFASALADGDVVDVVAYGTFNVASIDASNITSGSLNIARIADGSITNAKLTTPFVLTAPTISGIAPDTITNDANNIVITGTNYVITPNVEIISTTGAIYYPNTVTRNSSSQLTINATLTVDGTYYIRVENPDGIAVRSSTALLTVSDAPTWSTASGSIGSVAKGASFSSTLSASSDSAVTYSKTSGNFPTGLTLNSSTGVISGTESGADTGETVYAFTITATDAETQTASRAFSITVTVGINNGVQFN